MKRLSRILTAVLCLGLLVGMTGCYTSPENGKIGVIRGDGIIEGHSGIKGIICPGSKAFVWNDETHTYPDSSSQRTFKFNTDKDADSGPIEGLRTKDGVKVTLQGTVYFKTAFDCTPRGKVLVRKFDEANSARPGGQQPWKDFAGYLANQWKPILDSTARDVILGIECKDVVSSCALLARDNQPVNPDAVNNKSNVQAIEAALNNGLQEQLKAKLGEDYFVGITFNMEQPTLPEVDDAIASAQAAYAKVADVRAERLKQVEQVKVEEQKRLVAKKKARQYAVCPSCARQDEYRALPSGLQVLGGNPATVLGR